MASNIVNDGKFYIVDLETQGGLCVAVISEFWLHDTNFCYYRDKRGDIACAKREQPNSTWLNYRCVYRGLFDTYSQARDKVSRAVHNSDINTTSESEGNRLGRGKRIKKTRTVYSPTPNQESSTEDMESDMESPSSVPPIPNGLAETFNRSMVQASLTQSTQSQVESPGFYSSVNIIENHYEKTSDSGEPIQLHTSLSQKSTMASSPPTLHVQQLPSSTHLLPLPSHPVTQTQRSTSIPGSGTPAQLQWQQLKPATSTNEQYSCSQCPASAAIYTVAASSFSGNRHNTAIKIGIILCYAQNNWKRTAVRSKNSELLIQNCRQSRSSEN